MHHSPRLRWNGPRNAMLGYYVALGYEWEQIARAEDIRSTAEAVRSQAKRLGLVKRDRPMDLLPSGIMEIFDREAVQYEMSGPGLFRRFIKEAAADTTIIHNVVDIET